MLEVPAKECVITWDFDVLKCDVVFSLYQSDKKLGKFLYRRIVIRTSAVNDMQYLRL